MGRRPCCDKANVKKGPWTPEEDAKLLAHTSNHGTSNWASVPQRAGLKRCRRSCKLRYNHLRPSLKPENFPQEEEDLIVTLHAMLGSRACITSRQSEATCIRAICTLAIRPAPTAAAASSSVAPLQTVGVASRTGPSAVVGKRACAKNIRYA
ncbi:hypothetical protein ACQ4PT_047099 [Festuca glaucescens]